MQTQRTAFERQIDEVEEHNDRVAESEARAADTYSTAVSKDLARMYIGRPVSAIVTFKGGLMRRIRKFFEDIKRKRDIKKGVYSNKQRLVYKDGKPMWEYVK